MEKNYNIENKPYLYFTKHGLGPGTLPNDVHVVKSKDLDNYMTAIWLDRFLTTKELDNYDIYPETMNNEFKEKYDISESYDDVNSDNAFDVLDDMAELFGHKEMLDALAKAMGTSNLADNLSYICRQYEYDPAKNFDISENLNKSQIREGFIGQTLEDFLNDLNNKTDITIWCYEIDEDNPVYEGDYSEIPQKYLDAQFDDFDIEGKLFVNISDVENQDYNRIKTGIRESKVNDLNLEKAKKQIAKLSGGDVYCEQKSDDKTKYVFKSIKNDKTVGYYDSNSGETNFIQKENINKYNVFESLTDDDIEKLGKYTLEEDELSHLLSLFELIDDDNKLKAFELIDALFSGKKLVPTEEDEISENISNNTQICDNNNEYTRRLLGDM